MKDALVTVVEHSHYLKKAERLLSGMSEYFESIRKGAKEALAWKQGKDTGARVRQYTALDVTEIRKKTKMTQKEFSQSFQIPLSTLRQWEQGKRLPQGPAQALLKIIAYDSDIAIEALHKQ